MAFSSFGMAAALVGALPCFLLLGGLVEVGGLGGFGYMQIPTCKRVGTAVVGELNSVASFSDFSFHVYHIKRAKMTR